MAQSTTFKYEDIKKAVFYSQQKPELLAGIIADVASVTKEEATTPDAGEETKDQ